jgi:hypothetical protein
MAPQKRIPENNSTVLPFILPLFPSCEALKSHRHLAASNQRAVSTNLLAGHWNAQVAEMLTGCSKDPKGEAHENRRAERYFPVR